MLNPEEAKKILQTHEIPHHRTKILETVKLLPETLRTSAYAIMHHDASGKPYKTGTYYLGAPSKAAHDAQMAAVKHLDSLSPAERIRVFEAYFPKIAANVEQAWHLLARLPYQIGYYRKAFRVPTHMEASYHGRAYWLNQMVHYAGAYAEDVQWLAVWAPYIAHGYGARQLGTLFAAVIDAGGAEGDAVFDILLASGRGDHEIGGMGAHVVKGLLAASRPEGWTFVEKLLLAAQREEGLRQHILEAIDESHPQAFRRMLRVIIDNNLARFSAVTRAMNVWMGFAWDSENTRIVNQTLETLLTLLENPAAQQEALRSDSAETVYLALWSLAYDNALTAVEPAARLRADSRVEHRFAAARLLAQLGLPQSQQALLPALDDPDLRIAVTAFESVQRGEFPGADDLFERVEQLLPRLPKSATFDPLIWSWMRVSVIRDRVAYALLYLLGSRSPRRLIPHLQYMDDGGRGNTAEHLSKVTPWDQEIRDTLLGLLGDPSRHVRERVQKVLAKASLTPDEAQQHLEGLLTRSASDLRRGVLSLLSQQTDEAALASAERLLASSKLPQRMAGLELLYMLTKAHRQPDQARARAAQYPTQRAKVSDDETEFVKLILAQDSDSQPTLDNALGLMNPAERAPAVPPQKRTNQFFSQATLEYVKSLDDLIHEHRTQPIMIKTWQGEQEILLGDIGWGFPKIDPQIPIEEDAQRLPARELWENWWAQRPAEQRDTDGRELIRALLLFHSPSERNDHQPSHQPLLALFKTEKFKLRYSTLVLNVLTWLTHLHPAEGAVDLLLDAVETTLFTISEIMLKEPQTGEGSRLTDWRSNSWLGALTLTRFHRGWCPDSWTDAHHIRLWQLVHWLDQGGGAARHRPQLDELLAAYRLGAATETDLYDQLLGPRPEQRYARFDDLHTLTSQRPHRLLKEFPALEMAVNRCRERILEIELQRGAMPTPASQPALSLRSSGGIEIFTRILQGFGQEKLVRGWTYDNISKAAVFSHLLRISFPAENDTQKAFAKRVKQAKIPQKRLIEAAMYAPQWANYVEFALGWSHFAEAIYWIHAHTKDQHWRVDQAIREGWQAQVSERTALSGEDLLEGAVDVAWFKTIYAALGAERWQAINQAVKFASGGTGHTRAQLFADAMLGSLNVADCVNRITLKRHQDSLRALGLIPLSAETDVLERYQVIQEFLRTSRQFGSQRQASEKTAARIAMDNLARTAGYPDPVRLQWAMEARAIADLKQGAIAVTVEDVTVTLLLDDFGKPHLEASRAEKRLKSIPAKLKKVPAVADLQARKRDIDRQISRMRLSLENAMCRGDAFSGAELRDLLDHPVLAPMLEQVVFINETLSGYPVLEDGQLTLHHYNGSRTPVSPETMLRIAHPHDLFKAGNWQHWQHECFIAERIQPFKQVFRELYVLTATEQSDGAISRRYAGNQVQPRQAMALFGQRGWITSPDSGVQKTFHHEGLTAYPTFMYGWTTPAEVEGLTLEGVIFRRPGEWNPIPLEEVPPRVFSEVMRDMDLVVSVAHRGGIDPEHSASTIEMRTALIRETCTLLKVTNVELQSKYALIEGKLGSYSIHLGSGVVHRQPGGALCVVPVHAQHRGRLFLPFADDDPKTAEVLSKILLFARDGDIKDPTILQQIIAVA